MADADAGAPDANDNASDTPEPKTFDEDYVKRLRAENAKYRNDAKANADAAQRLAAFEEAQKTESQKLEERASRAESALPTLELENARLRVALAKGLPAELVDRLRGTTPEELETDADELLQWVKTKTADDEPEQDASPFVQPIDLGQGPRGTSPPALGSNELLDAVQKMVGA